MARFRLGQAVLLILLVFAAASPASAQPAATPSGLYDRPVLVIEPGMHTAMIRRADVDRAGRWAVTGSDDKTVRIWSVEDGALVRTIRLPAGPGNVGKANAVAISPDGAVIAVGGWTRWTKADPQEQIYLFDRATGALLQRIDGLPNVVLHLAFARDGRRLVATLGDGGVRLYGRSLDWVEIARDEDYRGRSNGAAFSPDGSLATTAYDGQVRLYGRDLRGRMHPAMAIAAPDGQRPFGIAFSPDGTSLAIGYADRAVVSLLDGRTLATLPGPDLQGIEGGELSKVAWLRDATLVAGGTHAPIDKRVVLAWGDRGAGARRVLPAAMDVVMSLAPLPSGDFLVATGDPWLARLQADGGQRWVRPPPKADFRAQHSTLSVSSDGTRVDFGFAYGGDRPARFDLATRALSLAPSRDERTVPPRQDGLPVEDWISSPAPTLGGQKLALYALERSRSLVIRPTGDRFVLGADWSLRAFDASGTPLWTRAVPGAVWAVNITGDDRLVVAAYDDGTIRWHRMRDGVELLAFMPMADRTNWVAWTPEGFYAATAGAHGTLRWQVNHGWDAPAETVAVEDIPGSYRPEVLALVLQEMETPRALGLAVLAEHNKLVQLRTNSRLPPGVQLHVLTIGISTYNEEQAKNLRLQFAHRDAHDLASALVSTQGRLYAQVKPQALLDKDATKDGILRALKSMRAGMEGRNNDDLAVVHFSGHGAMIGEKHDKLYLLPHDVDARDVVGIQSKGLWIEEFRGELMELAKRGRVLVLLDACHSGATTSGGARLDMDSTALRSGLAAANVTVLTSSSGTEVSREDAGWGYGAFTKVLLDALTDPAADTHRTGLISPAGLAGYVSTRVRSLTEGKQTPGMEVRYDSTVFARGL